MRRDADFFPEPLGPLQCQQVLIRPSTGSNTGSSMINVPSDSLLAGFMPLVRNATVSYDVFPRGDVSDDRMLIVIADVAGKSIPAALLMATFQASLRTLSESGCSLPELTDGLNRYLSAHSRGGLRFTTAFLAEFASGTGCLTYINAGHNAPVLSRASGSMLERLEAGACRLESVPTRSTTVAR